MRNIFITSVFMIYATCLMGQVAINDINFPDANFMAIVTGSAIDTDNDDVLSDSEIQAVASLDVSSSSISDLTGIEHFTALTRLDCYSNSLTSLDVSKNTALKELDCYSNSLTSLDVSKNTALKELDCDNNKLPSLDVSKNTALITLLCYSNRLASLDVTNNTVLTSLNCHTNQLTSLDVSKNTALIALLCHSNQLPSLDVSKNTALITLFCDTNQLPSLDVSKNTALTTLLCHSNQLTRLDVKNGNNANMTTFDARFNTNLTCIQADATTVPSGASWAKDAGASYSTRCLYINDINFPDANFRAIVTGNTIDTTDDDVLSDSEIQAVASLDVSSSSISDLTGIEYFTALTRLECDDNQLTSLDVSKNTALTRLECFDNQLTSLDVKNGQNTKLTTFNATSNTNLTCIQVDATTVPSGANWTKDAGASYSTRCLYINDINFPDANFRAIVTGSAIDTTDDDVLSDSEIQAVASLDVSSQSISNLKGIEHFTALTGLNCSNNQLTSLDVSKNTALITLFCNTNQLTSLDVSKNTALTFLDCGINQLTSLDVSNNTALTRLYCYSNQLTSLDVSKNTALITLFCNTNQLTSLDVSKNTALTYLDCNTNQLTSLDVSKNTALTYLDCGINQLTSLNVKNGLNNILTTFNATSNTNLTCIQVDATTVPSGANWTKDAGASYSTRCLYINDINFPDANFRAIVTGSAIDTTDDDVLSDSEIQAVTSLDVSGETISDLKGIEYFTALTQLYCYSNQLPSLDVSKNTALTTLWCYSNKLTSLDVSKNTALITLFCNTNQLTSLDVSKNTALTYLDCGINQLTSLDVSNNTALTRLYCYSNQLTSLDVSNNTALTRLYCDNNKLPSLDVSKNTALTRLYCDNNKLPSLDVSKNTALTRLYCDNNKLPSLDVSNNTALTTLLCYSNQLTRLDVKNGNNANMTTFDARFNTNLTCIQADATTVASVPSGWTKPSGASYSTDCNYVVWTGTDTDWATVGNWSENAVPTAQDHVTIPVTSNDPIIGVGTNAEARDIIINSGASLTIDGNLNVNNNATYIRNLTTTNWYLVSSPVTGETYDDDYVTANSIASSNSNRGIATYNTTNDTWSYMQGGGSGTFAKGKGYSVKRESAGDISFTGTSFNTGDVSIAIDNSNNRFNLIGNPYATHINSNPFLTSNTAKLEDETIWVWDQNMGAYETKVSTMNFKLAPTQGFFAKVKTTATGNLTFDYSAIKSSGGTFQKTDLSQIKLSITDGASKRQARVLYYDAATKGFDNGGDGEAFGGGVPSKFDVYTHLLKDDKGKKYQVQSLPKAEIGSMIIPVGVKAGAGKEITFSIEKLNIPSSIEVILEDRTKGTFTKLDNGNNYKVLTSASDDIGRFYLHTTQAALNILDNKTISEVSVYETDNSRLRVVGLPIGDATVRIYNILGKEIINSSFSTTGVKDISLPNLSSGIYIISIETETGKLTRKVSF